MPGYTEVTNGPLRTLEAMSPNPITYQNSGHPRWVGTVPIVSSQSSFNQWFNDSAGSSLRTRTRSERWSWRRTGGCTYTFQRPHYCGDGILDPEEQCDLGNQNGVSGSGCGTDCKRIIG